MKLTKVEKIILENTDKNFKYIVRDTIGELYLFTEKPVKFKTIWWLLGNPFCSMGAFNHLFQDIKWEDEEPYKFR